MADVRQMLGAAPEVAVTEGTVGRASEDWLGGAAQALSQGASDINRIFTIDAQKKKRQEDAAKAAAEADIYATAIGTYADVAGVSAQERGDPQLQKVSAAAAAVNAQAERRAAAGMDAAAVARRKLQDMTKLVARYPAYGEQIMKAYGGEDSLRSALTEQGNYERDLARKQQEQQDASVRALYEAGTGDPLASIEDQRAWVAEVHAPAVTRIKNYDRQREVLEAEGKYSTALEEEGVLNNQADINVTLITGIQTAWNANKGDVVQQRAAIGTAMAQSDMWIRRNFPRIAANPERMRALFGGAQTYYDNAMKLLDDRLPENERKRIEDQNALIKAQEEARMLTKFPGLAPMAVLEKLTPRSVDGSFTNVEKAKQWRTTLAPVLAYAAARAGAAAPPPPDGSGGNGEGTIADKQNPAKVESVFTRLGNTFRSWMGEVNTADGEVKDAGAYALANMLNDPQHNITSKGIVGMLPMLADPRTAELVSDSKFLPQLTEAGGKRLNAAYATLQENVKREQADFDSKVDYTWDEGKGEAVIKLKSVQIGVGNPLNWRDGMSNLSKLNEQRKLYSTVTKVNERLNQLIKARAHLEGHTDYKRAAQAIFAGD